MFYVLHAHVYRSVKVVDQIESKCLLYALNEQFTRLCTSKKMINR